MVTLAVDGYFLPKNQVWGGKRDVRIYTADEGLGEDVMKMARDDGLLIPVQTYASELVNRLKPRNKLEVLAI